MKENDIHFDLGSKTCECGCKSFNVVYIPTPSTPAGVWMILTRCTSCGTDYRMYANAEYEKHELVSVYNSQGN